jgi:hypothetical protein
MENSFQDVLKLGPIEGGVGVFASAPIPAGAFIVTLRGPPSSRPSRKTIQVDDSLHLDEDGLIDGEINHSCHPSAFVDSSDPSRPCIRACQPIPKESEITIDYCASEDEMAEPFECRCKSEGCYGFIRGYAFLSQEQRAAMNGRVSPYLQEKYGQDG